MAKSTCKQCESTLTGMRRLFCSDVCKWTWHNNNRSLPLNVEYDCEVCGKHVAKYMTPSEQRREHVSNRFCSRTCAGVWRRGENHPMWNGGIKIDKDGYVLVMCPGHVDANKTGYVREHRLVMESKLKRRLTKRECVHHINGNRSDNRVSNLKLFASHTEHMRHEAKTLKRNKTNGRFEHKKARRKRRSV